jgi:hypothetical protein
MHPKMGRQPHSPLSLESITFKKMITSKKARKQTLTSTSLTAPLMKQWTNLINRVANYRVMFTTINITDVSGIPTTKCELMVRALDKVEFLPSCLDSIVVQWMDEDGWIDEDFVMDGVSSGIAITSGDNDPILFEWADYYNYDFVGCNYTRVYIKDGIIHERWFSEDENPFHQQSPAVGQHLLSRDVLSLSDDGSLIWSISKLIRGTFDQEDVIMHWTSKSCKVT